MSPLSTWQRFSKGLLDLACQVSVCRKWNRSVEWDWNPGPLLIRSGYFSKSCKERIRIETTLCLVQWRSCCMLEEGSEFKRDSHLLDWDSNPWLCLQCWRYCMSNFIDVRKMKLDWNSNLWSLLQCWKFFTNSCKDPRNMWLTLAWDSILWSFPQWWKYLINNYDRKLRMEGNQLAHNNRTVDSQT